MRACLELSLVWNRSYQAIPVVTKEGVELDRMSEVVMEFDDNNILDATEGNFRRGWRKSEGRVEVSENRNVIRYNNRLPYYCEKIRMRRSDKVFRCMIMYLSRD